VRPRTSWYSSWGTTRPTLRSLLTWASLRLPSGRPCGPTCSCSRQPDAATLADLLGEEDPAVEHTLSMEALGAHWDELPRREQTILLMRFYGDMTQAEIGSKLGISQMHVSRLIAHALTYLRGRILGPELAASA
jgi:RNA polymerase sigma factor (sigma-70 family)